ncbi:hypothetical protein CRE_26676 [Caenorhabditis remanei]|uniref:DUF38 domain-containing protein n=1 Tax=Caenorhabditis remanei TaxID=31234 RepID=E3MKW8_CAERE|nr:hypothetical protein CRE_26676 [Caenorhabditis remanei]
MLLSVVSMRAKKIVCSLNFDPRKISLDTCASCKLEFRSYSFYISLSFEKFEEDAEREIVEIERPERVEFYVARLVGNRIESEKYQWENGTFEVRDYIDHFMEIFHNDCIDELTVKREDAYPLESIQQLINGLEIRELEIYERNSEDDLMNRLKKIFFFRLS